MANSLGFWTNKEINTDLHFNLWKLPYKKKKRDEEHKYFLDIGILLKKNELDNNLIIRIFVPFKLDEKDFYDLSNIMIKDNHLLNATFNKPLVYDKDDVKDRYLIIDEENKDDSFYIYLIKNKTIKYCNDHSEINIRINKDIIKDKNTYLRFRLNLVDEKFSKFVHERDSFLKSAYKKEELIEFRINELRNLPKNAQEFFSKELNSINITQIHYFLVRGNDANLVLSHKSFKRCRSVEHEIWQKYINDDRCSLNDHKSILSYHWSESNDSGIQHYGAFAKFSYTRTDRFITYFLLFVLISIVLELVANGLYDLIKDTNNPIIDVFSIIIMLTLLIPSIYFILKYSYKTLKIILKFLRFVICCPKNDGEER